MKKLLPLVITFVFLFSGCGTSSSTTGDGGVISAAKKSVALNYGQTVVMKDDSAQSTTVQYVGVEGDYCHFQVDGQMNYVAVNTPKTFSGKSYGPTSFDIKCGGGTTVEVIVPADWEITSQ